MIYKIILITIVLLFTGCCNDQCGKDSQSNKNEKDVFPIVTLDIVCDKEGYAYSRTYGSHGEINYTPLFYNLQNGSASGRKCENYKKTL